MADFDSLFSLFEKNADPSTAQGMSAYMRNQFSYLGLKTPKRKELSKDFLKSLKKEKSVNWDFINTCWSNQYREFKYVAINYLDYISDLLSPADIVDLKKLILAESWWDTIDGLDSIVGRIALNYPEVNKTLLDWSKNENFWLRRVAIDHQNQRKEKTDTDLLEKIIENNLEQQEFFINKAIGWSLREYSKTNPDWVRDFIRRYRDRLSLLSIREASKYI